MRVIVDICASSTNCEAELKKARDLGLWAEVHTYDGPAGGNPQIVISTYEDIPTDHDGGKDKREAERDHDPVGSELRLLGLLFEWGYEDPITSVEIQKGLRLDTRQVLGQWANIPK